MTKLHDVCQFSPVNPHEGDTLSRPEYLLPTIQSIIQQQLIDPTILNNDGETAFDLLLQQPIRYRDQASCITFLLSKSYSSSNPLSLLPTHSPLLFITNYPHFIRSKLALINLFASTALHNGDIKTLTLALIGLVTGPESTNTSTLLHSQPKTLLSTLQPKLGQRIQDDRFPMPTTTETENCKLEEVLSFTNIMTDELYDQVKFLINSILSIHLSKYSPSTTSSTSTTTQSNHNDSITNDKNNNNNNNTTNYPSQQIDPSTLLPITFYNALSQTCQRLIHNTSLPKHTRLCIGLYIIRTMYQYFPSKATQIFTSTKNPLRISIDQCDLCEIDKCILLSPVKPYTYLNSRHTIPNAIDTTSQFFPNPIKQSLFDTNINHFYSIINAAPESLHEFIRFTTPLFIDGNDSYPLAHSEGILEEVTSYDHEGGGIITHATITSKYYSYYVTSPTTDEEIQQYNNLLGQYSETKNLQLISNFSGILLPSVSMLIRLLTSSEFQNVHPMAALFLFKLYLIRNDIIILDFGIIATLFNHAIKFYIDEIPINTFSSTSSVLSSTSKSWIDLPQLHYILNLFRWQFEYQSVHFSATSPSNSKIYNINDVFTKHHKNIKSVKTKIPKPIMVDHNNIMGTLNELMKQLSNYLGDEDDEDLQISISTTTPNITKSTPSKSKNKSSITSTTKSITHSKSNNNSNNNTNNNNRNTITTTKNTTSTTTTTSTTNTTNSINSTNSIPSTNVSIPPLKGSTTNQWSLFDLTYLSNVNPLLRYSDTIHNDNDMLLLGLPKSVVKVPTTNVNTTNSTINVLAGENVIPLTSQLLHKTAQCLQPKHKQRLPLHYSTLYHMPLSSYIFSYFMRGFAAHNDEFYHKYTMEHDDDGLSPPLLNINIFTPLLTCRYLQLLQMFLSSTIILPYDSLSLLQSTIVPIIHPQVYQRPASDDQELIEELKFIHSPAYTNPTATSTPTPPPPVTTEPATIQSRPSSAISTISNSSISSNSSIDLEEESSILIEITPSTTNIDTTLITTPTKSNPDSPIMTEMTQTQFDAAHKRLVDPKAWTRFQMSDVTQIFRTLLPKYTPEQLDQFMMTVNSNSNTPITTNSTLFPSIFSPQLIPLSLTTSLFSPQPDLTPPIQSYTRHKVKTITHPDERHEYEPLSFILPHFGLLDALHSSSTNVHAYGVLFNMFSSVLTTYRIYNQKSTSVVNTTYNQNLIFNDLTCNCSTIYQFSELQTYEPLLYSIIALYSNNPDLNVPLLPHARIGNKIEPLLQSLFRTYFQTYAKPSQDDINPFVPYYILSDLFSMNRSLVFNRLLNHPQVSVNVPDQEGLTPLARIILHYSYSNQTHLSLDYAAVVINLLLHVNASPFVYGEKGIPLIHTLLRSRFPILKRIIPCILELHPTLALLQNSNGFLPIQTALTLVNFPFHPPTIESLLRLTPPREIYRPLYTRGKACGTIFNLILGGYFLPESNHQHQRLINLSTSAILGETFDVQIATILALVLEYMCISFS